MPDAYDILVVGGGPAGSTFAALSARAGYSVCLLEREPFPRDRVGESITVDCAKRLVRLGLPSPLLKDPPCWRIGAMRVHYEGGGSYLARFPEELRHFLVRRSSFDQELLTAARQSGAEVREEGARRLLIEDGRAVGVSLGDGRAICARLLVAAAVGRDTGILRSAGLTYLPDPRLSIFGARAFCRLPWRLPRDEVALYVKGRDIAVLTPLENGEVTAVFMLLGEPVQAKGASLGAEGRADFAGREGAFFSLLARFPSLYERLRGVPLEGSIEFQARMAQCSSRFEVKRLALLGNALGYSDPLLSHGVDYAVAHAATLSEVLKVRDLDRELARYHAAGRRMVWLDVALHRVAYEVLWREGLYRTILPDEALVSGVRLGEGVLDFLWKLAGLVR